jgi:hypothetical protein
MEDMIYCTPAQIELETLATCLNDAGYESRINEDRVGISVIVFYEAEYQGKIHKTYSRWNKLEEGLLGFEPEQQVRFQNQLPDLRTAFSINYNFRTIPYLLHILETVLNCSEGFVYCEGEFFDKHNLNDMRNLKLHRPE